ncbi:uncharacterized protein LOC100906295 [Galendromus occidentalis]|uniref:Uncharacterized protein LOC100906295 n=1 Tax=Galendromus occidentalis TaxID=34638 RepID=A0AAJ6QQJ8_9ACAR|nr:uncharacterized protein LOC100906295 [Galendromus occidentalis]
MKSLYSTVLSLCIVIAFVSGASCQYRDSPEEQSASASDEDGTGGDDSATDYSNGFESSEDDADTGTTVLNSDQRDGEESGPSLRASTVLPRISPSLTNHILDVSPKNPDESPVVVKSESGPGSRGGPRLPYPSRADDDENQSDGDDEFNQSDDGSTSVRGSEVDYINRLREMVGWPSVLRHSPPFLQSLFDERSKLQAKLLEMEKERIKLRTILSQIKGILNTMHERSSWGTSNMTSHETRIARLRNLFLILGAITNFTPLTHDQLAKFNYDVGLFDPKITEDGKNAFAQRISTLLRNRFPLGRYSELNHNEIRNSYPPVFLRSHHATNPQELPRETVEMKLHRLRNIYLLVRPLVTGEKLTSEELRELSESRDGFFEPGVNDTRKIEIITRIAESIRTSHLSQKLIEGSRLRSMKATSAPTTTETASTSRAPPTSYSHNSVLVIRMAPKRDDDSMHISGKIQMDLKIEGDMRPEERDNGLLSKLL